MPKLQAIATAVPATKVDQDYVREFAREESVFLVCGRYKGIDDRVVRAYASDEISIGDYVLAGGEAAALVMIEAIARLLPGVLGVARRLFFPGDNRTAEAEGSS